MASALDVKRMAGPDSHASASVDIVVKGGGEHPDQAAWNAKRVISMAGDDQP